MRVVATFSGISLARVEEIFAEAEFGR